MKKQLFLGFMLFSVPFFASPSFLEGLVINSPSELGSGAAVSLVAAGFLMSECVAMTDPDRPQDNDNQPAAVNSWYRNNAFLLGAAGAGFILISSGMMAGNADCSFVDQFKSIPLKLTALGAGAVAGALKNKPWTWRAAQQPPLAPQAVQPGSRQ